MSNVLCQIRGTKHIRLWPPSEVSGAIVYSFSVRKICAIHYTCLSLGLNATSRAAGQKGTLPRMKT